MANRPRSSLLDLFDPLLADAIRVPIPDSPPSTPWTPQKSPDYGAENKENVAPNELTMSVFFNRISSNPVPQAMKDSGIRSGPLVEFEDAEEGFVGKQGEKAQVSPRIPLAELSVDEFATPATPRLIYGSAKKKTVSPSHPRASRSSPSHTAQHASYPFPVISVLDSSQHTDSTRSPAVNPVLSRELQLRRDPAPESPRTLMPPASSSRSSLMYSRRRSSIDISMTLSSLSSNSFHLPDASFDLLNGEISFLSKSSEEEDVGQDVFIEQLQRETPRIRLPLQKLITEESPLDLMVSQTTSGGWEKTPSPLPNCMGPDGREEGQHRRFEEILLNTITPSPESDSSATTAHSIRPAVISSNTTHNRQRTLSMVPSSPAATVRYGDIFIPEVDAMSGSRASPVSLEGPDTPLSARRISSVPAPMKKLRVFTSSHRRAAVDSETHVTPAGITAASKLAARTMTSTASPKAGTGGGRDGDSSGISGGARRVPIVRAMAEQHDAKPTMLKRPLSSNSSATNIGVPTRSVRPTSSALHKPSSIARVPRAGNTSTAASRLPGPAAARDTMLPRHGAVSRLPAPSQGISKGRGIPGRPVSRVARAGRVAED